MEYYLVPSKVRAVREEDLMGLPRGFRFHPTDEEIVVHYLIPKTLNSNFRAAAIGQADFNKCEPWDLPKKENMGDTEQYYYSQRDRKYPSGLRTNRATKAGYWKATGKDKEIYKGVGRELVGMMKTLVFYIGRAPNGKKTNWVMHEFRLQQHGQFSSIPKDDGWVVSRVFHKNDKGGGGNYHKRTSNGNSSFSPIQAGSDSFSVDELIRDDVESLPPLVDPSAVPPSSNMCMSQVQDLKRKAVMPISCSFPHQSVNMQSNIRHLNPSADAYDDDQLIYSDDPAYYYPSLSETLVQALDPLGYEDIKSTKNFVGSTMMNDYNGCKKEQLCPSSSAISVPPHQMGNNNNDVDVSFYGQEYDGEFPTPQGSSTPDLSKLASAGRLYSYTARTIYRDAV